MPKFISDDEMEKLAPAKKFISDEEMTQMEQGPSQFESGVQGALSGAALGFRDELAGALEAGGQAVGLKGLGGDFSDLGFQTPVGFDTEKLGQIYEQGRNKKAAIMQQAQEANPVSYLAGNILGGGAATAGFGVPTSLTKAALSGAATGAVTGAGEAAPGDTLKGAALGGALGAATPLVLNAAGKLVLKGTEKVGSALSDKAKDLIIKATGATGKQADKFKPGTAEYLLENPEIRWWQSPSGIAEATGKLKEQAGERMGDIISSLDDSGITASKRQVIESIKGEIEQLRPLDAMKPAVDKLENLVSYMESTIGDLPDVSLTPSQVQAQKKAFADLVTKKGHYSVDAVSDIVNDAAARAYKTTGENLAETASPEIAQAFKAAKSEYGMLALVESAASSRAATMRQSPAGGFLDTTRAILGAQAGGVPGAIGTLIGGKMIAPRMSNVAAHAADRVGKLMQSAPQTLGKFAPIIQNAAARGRDAVAVTDWLLEQSDPEYRQMKRSQDDQ